MWRPGVLVRVYFDLPVYLIGFSSICCGSLEAAGVVVVAVVVVSYDNFIDT